MHTLIRLTVAAGSVCISFAALGQSRPEQELAAKLFDSTVAMQAEPVVDRLLKAATRDPSMPPAAAPIYREFMLDLFRSPKYRAAYIDAYARTFTETELRTLLDLANHPGFSLFLQKSQQITEQTYPAYLELLSDSRPELQRRLKAQGIGAK